MFNRERYWDRAIAGEFRCCRKPDSTPASPEEPSSSASAFVICSDDEGVREMFHAYVRTTSDGDETIGGSGKVDPKWLRQGSLVYRPELRADEKPGPRSGE